MNMVPGSLAADFAKASIAKAKAPTSNPKGGDNSEAAAGDALRRRRRRAARRCQRPGRRAAGRGRRRLAPQARLQSKSTAHADGKFGEGDGGEKKDDDKKSDDKPEKKPPKIGRDAQPGEIKTSRGEVLTPTKCDSDGKRTTLDGKPMPQHIQD